MCVCKMPGPNIHIYIYIYICIGSRTEGHSTQDHRIQDPQPRTTGTSHWELMGAQEPLGVNRGHWEPLGVNRGNLELIGTSRLF